MIPIQNITGETTLGNLDTSNITSAFLKSGSLQLKNLPPLSLYVHIPWCVKKCPYCDFNSHAVKNAIPEEFYLAALRADIEQSLPMIWGRKIYTVFIGGGTPSLLSAEGMDTLMSDIRTLLPLSIDAEITMEANPGTFEAEKFKAFRDAGINRLSIGIQSFNSQHLEKLGRIHNGDEAKRAIEIAQANFDNINLDLMYALPSQTLMEAEHDIETALSYNTPHMSLYQLTMEPNTLFAKYPPALPDDEESADIQDMIEEVMAHYRYQHYEVSAYAKVGMQARHNLNYWQFGDYLGIGAGAHSKISFPHRVIRQMRFKHPETYITNAQKGLFNQESREVDRNDLGFEFMLNALRLDAGVPINFFMERTGLPLSVIEEPLNNAERKGLLFRDHYVVKPTYLGKQFLNDLQEMFLAD